MAEVFLQSITGGWFQTFMYIDSGADVSLIPRQLGEALGFKLEKNKIEEVKGIGERVVPVQIKKVNLKIGSKTFRSRIAWSIIEEIPLILGRTDVFDRFEITFDQKNDVVVFKD